MSKILIKSRGEVEQMQFEPKTALISITDTDWSFAELIDEPDYVLWLDFDDVDNDIFIGVANDKREYIANKYHILSDQQAKQIAEFYAEIHDKVDTIICQCEHGQSRSAAVAAAILEYKNKSGIKVFAHDNYYPNKAVFNKVLQALKAIER